MGGVATAPEARAATTPADVRDLIERAQRRSAIGVTGANQLGGLIVFGFLLVIPVKGGPPLSDVLALNLPVGAVFLLGAAIAGPRWGRRISYRRLGWLREGRPPTKSEQRRFLRTPLDQLIVPGSIWAVASVVFSAINLPLSTELAGRMGTAMIMGGLTASAASYLVGERVLRPITARALAQGGVPVKPVVPGVVTRTVLVWALACGVPIGGIAMVASGVLNGDTPRSNVTFLSIIFLAAFALISGAVALVVAARTIAEPIQAVREGLARVEQGDLDTDIPVWDASEVGLLQAGFNRMGAGLRERERLQDLFGRYVGEDVARRALGAGVELGGAVREGAVLFVDVVGSTSLAARLPPEEVVTRLNDFFATVLAVVTEYGGWVNKFEGDAALCVFGVPTESDDAAGSALAAARALCRRLERDSPLEAGVGVSAGEVVAGNVGAAERFEYTVIGDPVNEAARLTELAKTRSPRVAASEAAVARASEAEAARWEPVDEVTLRGRTRPTRVHAPRD